MKTYTAEQRLAWLHSAESENVDGECWGIYRVKYENGQMVQCLQTFSDFSDLDAAITKSRESSAREETIYEKSARWNWPDGRPDL